MPEQPLVSADCPTSPNGLTPRGSRSHARICQSRRAQRGVLIHGFLFHTLLLATSLPFAGTVTRIRWSRDEPEVAHVLGTRFRLAGLRSSDTFGQVAVRHAADPLQDPFIFGFAVLGADSVAAAVRSPLDADSERFFRFRTGVHPSGRRRRQSALDHLRSRGSCPGPRGNSPRRHQHLRATDDLGVEYLQVWPLSR